LGPLDSDTNCGCYTRSFDLGFVSLFAEYSIFCKVKQALVHATWYGVAIAVAILCSPSRFFIKIVRSSRGTQVAAVLYRAYRYTRFDLRSQQHTNNNHPPWAHWFIVVSVAIGLLVAPNLFCTINPCHGSIVRKRSGGRKWSFHHFQYEKPYGYLLVSAVFLFTALSNVRTTV
jgi:hypothetical protein